MHIDYVGSRRQGLRVWAKNGHGAYALLGSRQAMMAAPRDGLPTKNEEYGTREYWCALTHHFVFLLKTPCKIQGPEICTVSLPRDFSAPRQTRAKRGSGDL